MPTAAARSHRRIWRTIVGIGSAADLDFVTTNWAASRAARGLQVPSMIGTSARRGEYCSDTPGRDLEQVAG